MNYATKTIKQLSQYKNEDNIKEFVENNKNEKECNFFLILKFIIEKVHISIIYNWIINPIFWKCIMLKSDHDRLIYHKQLVIRFNLNVYKFIYQIR